MGIKNKYLTLYLTLIINLNSFSQEIVIIDGIKTDYYDTERSKQILLTIKSSVFISDIESGYILEVGDDSYIQSTSNNLNNAKIIGNKFIWTGYDNYPSSTLHGIMAGYNINYTIKHNYFDRLRYTSVFKAGIESPLTWTKGAHSYNIHKNTKALTIKGIAGVRIYNNTFYSEGFSPLYHISLEENTGGDPDIPATNTTIKNNIFYQKGEFPAIRLRQNTCLQGFDCDYNVYFCEECENNQPIFNIGGTTYTWDEWRNLGFDQHSVVINPEFIDTINFVPNKRLDYGINIGQEHITGLAASAVWERGNYPDTIQQDDKWQVGAVLQKSSTSIVTNKNNSVNKELIISPNPNNGNFTLKMGELFYNKPLKIKIYSIGGNIVFQKDLFNYNAEESIEIKVAPGLYIIKEENSKAYNILVIN